MVPETERDCNINSKAPIILHLRQLKQIYKTLYPGYFVGVIFVDLCKILKSETIYES